jgi:hypothetical protein
MKGTHPVKTPAPQPLTYEDAKFRTALYRALQDPQVLRALAEAVHKAHALEVREQGEKGR